MSRARAGPATLAAKAGSTILPITIRRQPGDTFSVEWTGPITVASSDPAELQRATQAIADALKAMATDGSYKAALDKWGNDSGAITDFAVNP